MTYQKSILVLLISVFTVTLGFSQACDVTSDVNDICIDDEVRLEFLFPAPDNYGVSLNGLNQFVNIPHVPDLDFGTTDFSVEFWFNPTSSPTGPVMLFSKFSTSGVGYSIGYNAGLLTVTLNDGVSPVPLVITGSTPLNSNWQHCAVTFDRAGDCKIYLDGIQDAILPIAAVGSIANADPIGVGGPAVNVGGAAVFFDGKMDELRVWSRVLAASEILSNMNSHLNPNTQFGLNGYWDLNEGTGGFVIDCGTASQDGSLMSGSSFSNNTTDLPLTWNLGVTWSTGDVGNVIFDNPQDTTRYIAEAGYCKYFCVDSIDINVLPCDSSKEDFSEASVWIPNAFTPNADNKNDVFEIKASFITYFEVMVYARNGNLIFHSKNIQNAWDGNVQDKTSRDDTYTYVVVYRNMKNEEFKKFGYVTVLR